MKRLNSLIAIFVIFFGTSCTKDATDNPPDVYLTSLKETEVVLNSLGSTNMVSYDLDLDKDSENDVRIEVRSQFSPAYGSSQTIQLIPQNGFEMAFDSITYYIWSYAPNNPNSPDTVYGSRTKPFPLAMHSSEIISNQLNFSDQPRYFSYYQKSGASSGAYSGGHFYQVSASDYVYLAFRKETDNNTVWAWLKLKKAEKFGVVLNSCKYNNSSDVFIIE